MTGLWITMGMLVLATVAAGVRILRGPDDANRAVAADLIFFAFIGLMAVVGALLDSGQVFDVVLVASAVGFLAAVSLARILTRGRR